MLSWGGDLPATRAKKLKKKRRRPKKSKKDERRRWDRLPVAVPVFLRGADRNGREFVEFATALNLSAGGALLATRRHLPPESRITIEIASAPLPREKVPVHVVRSVDGHPVRVVHSEQCYLVGLRFYQPIHN